MTRFRIVSKHVDTAGGVGVKPINIEPIYSVPFSEMVHEDTLGVRKCSGRWFPKLSDIQRESILGQRCVQRFQRRAEGSLAPSRMRERIGPDQIIPRLST